MSKGTKKKPAWRLKVRRYPDTPYVSVWLEREVEAKGPWSGLLWGEVLPARVDELRILFGIPVEEEESPLPGGEPLTPPGCEPFSRQQELWP